MSSQIPRNNDAMPRAPVFIFSDAREARAFDEWLDMLGCYGNGKVRKLAEIIGAAVLAGEVSLSAAVLAGDWVTSHDALGRNR